MRTPSSSEQVADRRREAPREGELPGSVAYAAIGEGQPLAVLPGLSRDAGITRKTTGTYRALAAVTRRTVYVVGRPRGLPRGLSMHEFALRQAAALRALFPEPVDLLGISTGGAIALQVAVDHPRVVRRLVVVAAASWLGEEGRRKLGRYGQLISEGKSGAAVLASVLAPPGLRWLAAIGLRLEERSERRIDPADMLATIDAEREFDATSRLGCIKAPTLVVGGARDYAFSPELFQATAAGIPNVKLILYPKSGHIGTMVNPRFGRDVASFLAG